MLAVFLLILGSNACSDSKNNIGNAKLNEDCYSRGSCRGGTCRCCDQLSNSLCYDQGIVGKYTGADCDKVVTFETAVFGFLAKEDERVSCDNDELASAQPDLVTEVKAIVSAYNGVFQSSACQICTEANPCQDFANNIIGDKTIPTSGVYVKLYTNYNSHYDPNCVGVPADSCSKNTDGGIEAKEIVRIALENNVILKNISLALGFDDLVVEQVYLRELGDEVEGGILTRKPTYMPTKTPTRTPTKPVGVISTICKPYTDPIDNFRFVDVGIGASCRGNISESWPGARTCESPYLICLPQENTPAVDDEDMEWYFNNTHRYTVLQCQKECSFDQRCRGFEFVADANSNRGDCTLIDDIEVQVVNQFTGREPYVYHEDHTNLDSSFTGGNALCFEKLPETCHPYFEASELNETMLECYCPNNRKGSYTKKVKRTVENTRYCGDDSSVDERIKLAQANRMFHLCENWCLFNTLNPEQESWYWDPWKTCWYETYSGRGAHRGYCDRVIRNPDSIELQFVNRRADNFLSCDKTMTPTEAPVEDANVTYFLSEEVGSCDEACSSNGMTCAADQTARVFSSEQDLKAVFEAAGFPCTSENIIMNRTNWEGWALPGLGYGRICANRLPTLSHLEDLDSDCNRKIGEGWRRLCACYKEL